MRVYKQHQAANIDESYESEPSRESVALPLETAIIEDAEDKAAISRIDWPRLLQKSYMTLIDSVFHEEKYDRINAAENHVAWREQLWTLFANIPRATLEAALNGSLAWKHLSDKEPSIHIHYNRVEDTAEVDQAPWFLKSSNPYGLSIYLHQLVNEKGAAPTPYEFMQIVVALRQYASGADLDTALKIDNHFTDDRSTLEDLCDGKHWFFEGKEGRVRMLYQWYKAMELLCSEIPREQHTQPLPKPRSYCGYTHSIASRENEYMAHRSTTWLVGLVESTFAILLPHKDYKLCTYSISYIATEDEVQSAERAFMRCTESQLRYGGFCVAAPGQCSSAFFRGLKVDERIRRWNEQQAWRKEHMKQNFIENIDLEHRSLNPPFYVSPIQQDQTYLQVKRNLDRDTASIEKLVEELDHLWKRLESDLDGLYIAMDV